MDVVRGVVMVLMAIDHVRVYSGVPAGGPTAGVFFTRWVTHFCAPVFVFLAGTSAYLMLAGLPGLTPAGAKRTGRVIRPGISRFLLTRGALLVLLEPTLIRLSWTFSLDYSQFLLAGVIWMLGICMMLMAALVLLPLRAIARLRVRSWSSARTSSARCRPAGSRQFLYSGGEVATARATINVLYSIVPWIGVMALGYAFGSILTREPGAATALPAHRPLPRRPCSCRSPRRGHSLSRGGEDGRPLLLRMLESTEVSSVAALPADDTGASDRADAVRRSRARRVRRMFDVSAACRCSTTCCTSP